MCTSRTIPFADSSFSCRFLFKAPPLQKPHFCVCTPLAALYVRTICIGPLPPSSLWQSKHAQYCIPKGSLEPCFKKLPSQQTWSVHWSGRRLKTGEEAKWVGKVLLFPLPQPRCKSKLSLSLLHSLGGCLLGSVNGLFG